MDVSEATNDAKKTIHTGIDYAKGAARTVDKSAAKMEHNLDGVTNLYEDAAHYLDEGTTAIREQSQKMAKQVVASMKSRPVTSILIAAGVGVLLGLATRRMFATRT